MKHFLNFARRSSLSIITLTLASCGGDLAGVKMKDPLNKGTGGGKGDASKPAPPLGTLDRTTMIFNELNRVQRTLMNLSSPPPSAPADSCVKYVSTPKDKGIFLVARYDNCTFKQTLSGEKTDFVFSFIGREEYTANGDKAQARVIFNTSIARANSPRTPVSRSKVEHTVTISGKDKTKVVTADSIAGSEATTTADYSKVAIQEGEWMQTGARNLMMMKGSAISWLYRPANQSKSKASPSFKLILTANEDIAFGSKCPWPIKGEFELREVDQNGNDTIGTIEVNAKGYTGKDNVMHEWPTQECLGVRRVD